MIKSEKENVTTKGNNMILIIELNNLISHFIKYHPELLLGVFASRDEDLSNAIKTCNAEELSMAEFFSRLNSEVSKEVNDEGH